MRTSWTIKVYTCIQTIIKFTFMRFINKNSVGLCHAVNIREQLKKVLQRFKVKMVSCEGESSCMQKSWNLATVCFQGSTVMYKFFVHFRQSWTHPEMHSVRFFFPMLPDYTTQLLAATSNWLYCIAGNFHLFHPLLSWAKFFSHKVFVPC